MPLKPEEFYCVSCRQTVKPKPSVVCVMKTKNDRYMLKGECPQCPTNVFRFIAAAYYPAATRKYGNDCSNVRSYAKKNPSRSTKKSPCGADRFRSRETGRCRSKSPKRKSPKKSPKRKSPKRSPKRKSPKRMVRGPKP